jgi:ketosteroid isomerase-like protein
MQGVCGARGQAGGRAHTRIRAVALLVEIGEEIRPRAAAFRYNSRGPNQIKKEGTMAGEQNLAMAKEGYAAFSAGDAAGAMENIADDIEWITPGDSAISGTVRGKQEVGALWAKLAEKGFMTTPQYWFSDDERVVVLAQNSVAGETADVADVLTYRDGKLIRFQSAGDTAMLERVFGSK